MVFGTNITYDVLGMLKFVWMEGCLLLDHAGMAERIWDEIWHRDRLESGYFLLRIIVRFEWD